MNNLIRKYTIPILGALMFTACAQDMDLSTNNIVAGPVGNYDTRVTFAVSIDNVDVEVGVTPIVRASSKAVSSDVRQIWYVVLDTSGKIVPASDGKVMRHVDFTKAQEFAEYLPKGSYSARFLALGSANAMAEGNDVVNSITAADQAWLVSGSTNGLPVDGMYLYYDGKLDVVSSGANTMNVVLKPIVGEFKLDLKLASPEQAAAVTKVEVNFVDLPYSTFNANNTYATAATTALKVDMTADRSFYSLPTISGTGRGNVLITMNGSDGKSYTRTYPFDGLSLKVGERTTLTMSLDLAYNALGLISVDNTWSQASSCSLMLQNGEPSSVYTNKTKRSFNVSRPLKLTLDKATNLVQLQFYSPLPLNDVDVYVTIPGIAEPFKLYHFDVVPAFQEAYLDFKPTTLKASYTTESGKLITIPANSDLTSSDIHWVIKSSDPYYSKLDSLKARWDISFVDSHNGMELLPMNPTLVREAVAFALNMNVMFSSKFFEEGLYKWQGHLYARGDWGGPNMIDPVDTKDLYRRLLRIDFLEFGLLNPNNSDWAIGLHQGGCITWLEQYYYNHYSDAEGGGSQGYVMFHELAHVLGYGDFMGNMTIASADKGWTKLCDTTYRKMSQDMRLPVYSKTILNSKK